MQLKTTINTFHVWLLFYPFVELRISGNSRANICYFTYANKPIALFIAKGRLKSINTFLGFNSSTWMPTTMCFICEILFSQRWRRPRRLRLLRPRNQRGRNLYGGRRHETDRDGPRLHHDHRPQVRRQGQLRFLRDRQPTTAIGKKQNDDYWASLFLQKTFRLRN